MPRPITIFRFLSAGVEYYTLGAMPTTPIKDCLKCSKSQLADLLVQIKILFLDTGCSSSLAVTGFKRDLGKDNGNKNATADQDFPLFISRRRILHTRRHAHHYYQGLSKMFKKYGNLLVTGLTVVLVSLESRSVSQKLSGICGIQEMTVAKKMPRPIMIFRFLSAGIEYYTLGAMPNTPIKDCLKCSKCQFFN